MDLNKRRHQTIHLSTSKHDIKCWNINYRLSKSLTTKDWNQYQDKECSLEYRPVTAVTTQRRRSSHRRFNCTEDLYHSESNWLTPHTGKVKYLQDLWIWDRDSMNIVLWYVFYNTGRFMIFSVITNIYNKKTKGPTLIEFFTSTYDIQVLATHASTCWRVCGKKLSIVSMCAVSPVVHTSNISSCPKKTFSVFLWL
jgi:hypothetical protein